MIYKYKENNYPDYLKIGNAQSFIKKSALHFCKGNGLDIGGFDDWTLDGSFPINITDTSNDYDAYNLPNKEHDYIFSSHCLEHLENYVDALIHWTDHIKRNGVLFLYLPHYDMEYWRPQNNMKHLHQFYPDTMKKLLEDIGFDNVINSERDMYWSFSVVGFKK